MPSLCAREIRWSPPCTRVLKINADVALDRVGQWVGVGVVIRNSDGLVLGGLVKRVVDYGEPSWAEARAVIVELHLAHSIGFQQVLLESDYAIIITKPHSNVSDLSLLGHH